MTDKQLTKACQELSYTKSKTLTDNIFETTFFSLENLWTTCGYSSVLSELSKIWPLEKAIPFFTKANIETNSHNEIKTIATHYHRAYNGGVERVQAQLMTLWVKMGYKVVLFTEETASELDYPYPNAVKRIIIPPPFDISGRLSALEKHLAEEHVDLYVNHNWTNPSVLWECMLLKMIHVPFVQYIHGHFAWSIASAKWCLYQPELFKLCDIVLSLSETNARFYQMCGCKSYLVQNPVPEDLANNTSLSDLSSNHILMVGRLSAEKRPMDAIRIFKLVHDQLPNTVLDVVGGDDGDFILQMQAYIEENGLTNSVIFHGNKGQADVAEFYKASSCVLFTSEMEGYPMVILESKSYGLPLVMYNLPYLSLVKDGKGILTSPIGNITEMSAHLIRLLSDASLKKELGSKARESFDNFNSYDLENSWQNIIAICSSPKNEINTSSYFNPAHVTFADNFIAPMLLDAVKKGYDNVLESNLDYRVGRAVLKLPRICRNTLLKIRRLFK